MQAVDSKLFKPRSWAPGQYWGPKRGSTFKYIGKMFKDFLLKTYNATIREITTKHLTESWPWSFSEIFKWWEGPLLWQFIRIMFLNKIDLCQVGWNWLIGSREGDDNVKTNFDRIVTTPLKETFQWWGGPLFWQFRFMFFNRIDLCQVWLKLAHWFWRRCLKMQRLQTDG